MKFKIFSLVLLSIVLSDVEKSVSAAETNKGRKISSAQEATGTICGIVRDVTLMDGSYVQVYYQNSSGYAYITLNNKWAQQGLELAVKSMENKKLQFCAKTVGDQVSLLRLTTAAGDRGESFSQ